MMKAVGFIGYGSMGQMLGSNFAEYVSIYFVDPHVSNAPRAIKVSSIGELIAHVDVIVIATPAAAFADVVAELSTYDLSNCVVTDVLSTKTLAVEKYRTLLPQSVSVLSLHPLFGPPSITKLQPGLRIVSVLQQGEKARKLEQVLSQKFNLRVIRVSAEQHDKHMAAHHAIPFLLAHVLAKTDFNKDPGDLTIPSEQKLRAIVDIASAESIDLYLTIMRSNPYTKDAVAALLETLRAEQELLWPTVSAQ